MLNVLVACKQLTGLGGCLVTGRRDRDRLAWKGTQDLDTLAINVYDVGELIRSI